MTAAQLEKYALNRILGAPSFDTQNVPVKFLYLGQLRTDHFFLFTFVCEDNNCIAESSRIKKAVEILNEIGFKDLHWTHSIDSKENEYRYYCYIPDDIMLKIR